MKKMILSQLKAIRYTAIVLFVFSSGYFLATASQNIFVSAIVGTTNKTPIVLSRTPSATPVSIAKGTMKAFSIQIQDLENDPVSYTITPEVGSSSPINGTVVNTNSGNSYVNFTYIAPTVKPTTNSKKIILTLSDGPNLTTYSIQLYIY